MGGGIIPRLRRSGTRIKREDRGSHLLLWMSIFVSITVAFSFATSGIAMLPSWVYYPGIVLMVSGILLRQWSIAVLGPFFSGTVGVQEGQKVVETGPYRLVRHPSYTGALLTFVGLGLAGVLGSYYCALISIRSGVRLPHVCRGEGLGFGTRR